MGWTSVCTLGAPGADRETLFLLVAVRLSVKHTRILQLDEDVLCVRYSPNQKLLAVSLLDCTVKIFHTDTLKVSPCQGYVGAGTQDSGQSLLTKKVVYLLGAITLFTG